MRDPYEVLGVPRGAGAAAIKSAYRKLAKKHHPDSNKNDPKAAERFSEINSANEIIGDEDKRKQFDRGEIDAEGKPPAPTESDLVFARTAASDVLTKGDKDSSQPWENPETGARGSVTPLSQAYSAEDGRTCRDFLASYVNGRVESWLQGAACKASHGRWEIHTIKPWTRG